MKHRVVIKEITGQPTVDGAGVSLRRMLSKPDINEIDPFLMLDTFDSVDKEDYIKGFPWHPHRGIETVTYLFDGLVSHGDSLGNRGVISSGDCQWMTAGSGIIHEEMPQVSKHLYGFQLWVNLPKAQKMCDPQYRDIVHDKIPKVISETSITKIISGSFEHTKGYFDGGYAKVTILDALLNYESFWQHHVKQDDTCFLYLVDGSIKIEGKSYHKKSVLLLSPGETIVIKALSDQAHFVLFSGAKLKEPIAWGGPIVMNTKEELNLAFKELREGTFIK